jgi:ATP-binding cassette subfamily F protein 3
VSSTLLQLQNARKSFGVRNLFAGASFSVNENEHIGVIGPNGAGKTTLFKTLIGEEALDEGEVIRSRALRLGYLAQHDRFAPSLTIEDFLTMPVEGEGLAVEMPIWDLKSLGRGLGLREEDFARPLLSFSGGYRMRAKLLRLLGTKPNLMLLDEPTNYLDLETLLVLERFMQDFEGAFLLISHDREFLRRTTDHILEVEAGEMTKFPGTIDDYFDNKALLRAQLESRALSQQARRQEILDFAARFGAKASKARQAQSKLKLLNKMEHIEVKPLPVGAAIRIPAPRRVPKLAIRAQQAVAGYAERTILSNLHLELVGGDRVGVVGLNGAGKTTLLRSLAGDLPLLSGSVERGFEVTIGYYGQHVAERLNPADTVFDSLMGVADRDTTPQEILSLAGSLLFSGDDVQKRISVLSGGEKSRVALGQVLLMKASCLFLDEPTNHLDFGTVEALTQALAQWAGTVVVVSHDRGFIRRVATKILEVREGRAELYPGTYEDYVWSLEKGAWGANVRESAAAEGKGAKATKPASGSAVASNIAASTSAGVSSDTGVIRVAPMAGANWKERKSFVDKRLRAVAKRIAEIEKRLDQANIEMDAASVKLATLKGAEAEKQARELGALQTEVNGLEAEWLALGEEQAALNGELQALTGGGVT